MEATFRKQTSGHRWVIFIGGVLCIAAVGTSSHFFGLQRKEREKRIAAESKLKELSSELQLLKEKNRDLAQQLREAKRIAQELARQKEGLREAAAAVSPGAELAGRKDVPEKTIPPPREGARRDAGVSALRLEKVAQAASRVGASARQVWQGVRTAVAASVRLPHAQGASSAPAKRRLGDVMKSFPLDGFRRLAGQAKSSARETLGAVSALFSFDAGVSSAAVAPRLPAPSLRSEKLTATNEELRQQLKDVRQEKRELEMQIAERTGKISGSVNVGQVRVTTGRRFSGKVLVVNRKYDFVVIDIGRNQGLEKGEVLIVHRGSRFIGKAQVIKVYEKMAAADLVKDWMQDDVQVNDGVKKF